MITLANNARKLNISVNGKIINLLPPKLKTLREIAEVSKNIENMQEDDISSVTSIVSLILSRNDKNVEYSADWVENVLDIDDVKLLLRTYTDWVKSIQSSPNSKSHIAQKR